MYAKIYYVDQNHPKASDQNPGTENSPFHTISQAAKVLRPGEKVIIKKGIYRENVKPAVSGENEKAMICYEAQPGVILTGSDVLKEKWVNSRTPDTLSMQFSHKIWMTSIPYSYFKETNPFLTRNLDAYEISVMSWAKDWTGRVPYNLVRGLVFQDGKRMTQLSAYEDIVKLPGSYWVDTAHSEKYACTIHIHPFGGADPNTHLFEITTRQSPFNPRVKKINYIRVKGFTIQHAGNGFPVAGKGAFSTFGGRNWIIEDNTIRMINSVAMEIGAVTNRHIENEDDRDGFETVSGRHIVRNNTIYDCGTGGIQGLINRESLVEDNHIFNIGWQEAEFYYETAAIKLHFTHNCLVRRNHIHDIEAAMGIWLDAGNINSRVTQNLVHNVSCNFGGIFMEVSFRPNIVDNNLVWNCSKNGIYQHDADSLLIVHNIVGKSKENGIMMRTNKGRKKDNGEFTTARHNQVLYNILVDNKNPFSYSDTLNISDQNIISFSGSNSFDFHAWHKKGLDINSKLINISASFDTSKLVFSIKTTEDLPAVQRLLFIGEDMTGRKHSDPVFPGCFKNAGTERIQLAKYFRK